MRFRDTILKTTYRALVVVIFEVKITDAVRECVPDMEAFAASYILQSPQAGVCQEEKPGHTYKISARHAKST